MINVSFALCLPFQKWEYGPTHSGLFTENVAWELNVYKSSVVVKASIDVRPQGDHRGFAFWLGLFGYEVEFTVYDIRHEDQY